ncbi:cyclic AMP-dependent transcription factor ATF-2 isoform X2 [Drosophila montana]|uniref:cyclic AMP-dependent transcription factor ATF-2 isoform X2 n=1 Tax=Drosophila montana TaxID=40370 RepID=UPI00313D1004
METDANIADMTDVSFAEFETKTGDGNANFDNYGQCQAKHDMAMTLDLSLGQKAEQLFATDQTPTPTRLIKNCEEVGLFDDLQHVNPFDIGFQRAAEQNAVAGKALPATPTCAEAPATDGDSLHTPQVYPLEAATAAPVASQNSSPLDVPVTHVEELLQAPTPVPVPATVDNPPPLQLIQPPVITWVLPAQALPINAVPASVSKQTVRPFILPKPSVAGNNKVSTGIVVHSTQPVHEPSSASLTPTSQLPIKERLKAILNNSNNNRKQRNSSFSAPAPKAKAAVKRNEDCMERRRAAASRYRHKMRNEHKEIKDHNAQLQQEIRKLRERIKTLERELQQQHNNNNASVAGNQIQIPPSSIHLVINVPKMIVPSSTSNLMLDQK